MPTWPAHIQHALTYPLDHLNTFQHTFSQGGGKTGKLEERYVVTVQFTDHCFTAGSGARDDTSATVLYAAQVSRGERRFFSLRRYDLSQQLPEMVRGLMSRRCFFTQGNQYFIFDLVDENRHKVEYEMYFDVFKHGKRLVLSIETAFPRDPSRLASRPQLVPMNFASLLHAVQQGKNLRKPKQGRTH